MIFRWLIPVLKWFRLKIMNNHSLIIGNLLGMAWEIENYQVGFLKNICFFSFTSFLSILMFWKFDFPRSLEEGFFDFQNQNKSLYKPKNARLIIGLKNSIQFNSLFWLEANWSAVRKWRKLKVEIQWVKLSISEATH